ncbi:[NiFe] hydrogenase diaphorase moiety large subunit [Lutibacter oricola]|uniref:[NiFe] hydrogenase diaphorase moiety large subunit n=1 Tax=Lutibacter oricola TaxID=762486 RepID=A0A1H3EU02_9FLAO|nr:NAD(P)H-dependent oxidoreductase subunit E [Lutibacter oricola]SDX82241.1 [NiFe] hydrogenase diaphorase moiety large subunit [Lutibacter oricola]
MKRKRLLARLWQFQNDNGYIPQVSINKLAQELRVSKIEIEGVISFYHFFHKEPTNKYIIYLNKSIVSEFKGYNNVKKAFEKETNCTFETNNKDSLFSLFETPCIGLSDQEPAALINFYPFTNLTPQKVRSIIFHLKNGNNLKDISSNPTSKIQYKPAKNKTIFFRDYVLGNSIKKLKNLTQNQVLSELKNVGVSGRGGAFFQTATKWTYCKNNKNKPKYIICNADEGEPGTFKDKAILNNLPGLMLEGMILAAYVTGAKNGIIYLRAEYKYLQPKIEKAIALMYKSGFLGKNINGIKNFNFEIELQLGAGAYICGAETALIESLEGKRGEPRIRNLFPTEAGYLNKPTVVNNVETFALAARVIELGSCFFKNIGTKISKGTKLVSISGDIAKPGIFEIEWGTTINQLLSIEMCNASEPYYIQINGPSGVCINQNEFNRKIAKEDLACNGSIMVFNKNRNIIQIIENFTKFFRSESCGNCTPCRAGNQILLEKIKKIKNGIATANDLDDIKKWNNIMKLSSKCGLGKYSASTFSSAIDKFRNYFNKIIIKNKGEIKFDLEAAVFDYNELIQNTQN